MRRVYFSFDYERDLHRVNKFRQLPRVIAGAAAGFQNAKVWDKAKLRGDDAVHGLIKDGLNTTTVTVVCVGHMTSYRKYVIPTGIMIDSLCPLASATARRRSCGVSLRGA